MPDQTPVATVLDRVYATICDRRDHATAATSYVKKLLDAAPASVHAKILEEAGEVTTATGPDHLAHEVADLWFHTMVLLAAERVPVERVYEELARREGTSGLVEKASRTKG